MKLVRASLLVLGLLSLGAIGCGDRSSTSEETTVSTPGGTTTVKVEEEVTKTGENPPAEKP